VKGSLIRLIASSVFLIKILLQSSSPFSISEKYKNQDKSKKSKSQSKIKNKNKIKIKRTFPFLGFLFCLPLLCILSFG